MKLVIAVVQAKDAEPLIAALTGRGLRVTQINSAGGFLRESNVTLLLGVEEYQVSLIYQTIRRICQTRVQYVNPLLPIVEAGDYFPPEPIEVEVGGAAVFVIPIARYERL